VVRSLAAPAFRARLAFVAVWGALVLFLFPGVFNSLGVGIDASWAYAINALRTTDRLTGRDVAFTYGPLGWLLHPAAVSDNLELALRFRLLMQGLFAVALARALRGVSFARAFTFACLFLAACLLSLAEEYRLVILLALLLGPELAAPRRVPWAAAIAGALVPVFVLMRPNLGLSAAAMVAVFCGLTVLRRKPRRGRAVLAAAAGFTAAAAIAVPLVFGPPRHALRWLGLQAELVQGYAAGMGLPATPADLAAGILGLGVFAGLCFFAYRTGGALAGLWTVLALPVWFAFQLGFIRADSHTGAFFPFLLAAAALGFLFAESERGLRASGAACLVFLLLATAFALRSAEPASRGRVDFVLGIQGWRNLRNLKWAWEVDELQRMIERVQKRRLRPSRLPQDFVAPVRTAGLGVDVLPWELSILAANHLRWVPSPTLQLYSAYTRRLDALAALHFVDPAAPDLLLVHYGSIDGRDMLWDTPQTWRAVLAGYKLDPKRPAPELLALRRRPHPFTWDLELRGEARTEARQWIDVPAAGAGRWTFAEIELQPSWRGRVERLVLGVPPVLLDAVDDRGRRRTVRILPETAAGGLLMAPAPRNLDDLAALWGGGGSVPRIVGFRLDGPGLRCFKDEVRIRWLAGRLEGGALQ
jgi:hypothetical protein